MTSPTCRHTLTRLARDVDMGGWVKHVQELWSADEEMLLGAVPAWLAAMVLAGARQ